MLGLVEKDLRVAYAIPDKMARHKAVDAAKAKAMAHFLPEGVENPHYPKQQFGTVFKDLEAKIVRWNILDTGKRIDGRDVKTVRPIVRRSAFCRAPTARRCSPAARPRRWSSPRSAPARTSSSSTPCRGPTRRRSCCTTTSRPSRSARPAASARPAVARSATASWRGGRSVRSCRRRTSSPTRSAWSRRSPSPTARRRWRRSAAPRSR